MKQPSNKELRKIDVRVIDMAIDRIYRKRNMYSCIALNESYWFYANIFYDNAELVNPTTLYQAFYEAKGKPSWWDRFSDGYVEKRAQALEAFRAAVIEAKLEYEEQNIFQRFVKWLFEPCEYEVYK